jgi:uncharacterized protein YkwD
MRIAARFVPTCVLGAFLLFASVVCTQPGQAQTAGQTSGAPQTNTATKTQAGVWHHFGEANGASQQPAPVSGVWHSFGSTGNSLEGSSSASMAPRQCGTSWNGDLGKQMYELINRDRLNPADSGGRLQLLRWNEKLAAVARAHSLDMIRRRYFDHVDPDGRSPGGRMSSAGIIWRAEGENIAIAASVAAAETGFMNEPRFQQNHRWNILNSEYTDVGVGIVRAPNGEYYVTQDFIESVPGS